MHADHYFSIGTKHQAQGTPCEDYALSGMTASGQVFAVVSDGCSGATEVDASGSTIHSNTDVGARAISWAFKKAVNACISGEEIQFDEKFRNTLLDYFKQHRYAEGNLDYLATLVGIVAAPTQAAVFVQGDGAIAVKYKDGRIQLMELSWWDNMPYYLAYRFDTAQQDMFEKIYQEGIIEPFCKKTSEWLGSALDVKSSIERFSMADSIEGHVLRFNPQSEEIQAIAIFTDGVDQVGEIDTNKVVHELMAFKQSVKGSFVKRRMMRALQNFAKNGAAPKDDISMAVVWFDEGGDDEHI